MKKFLPLLLCILVLISSAFAESAMQPASEASFVGTWIENDGFGTLTLRLDGTAHMLYYDSTVTECHWAITEDGGRFTDGQWLNSPMKLLDNNTLSVANGWMVFTREGFLPTTDPAILLDATPVGDEGLPFFGEWRLVSLIIEDTEYDPALIDMSMTLHFNADGTVLTSDGMEDYTTTWAVSYDSAIVEGDILTINESGQLIYSAADGTMIFDPVLPEIPEHEVTEPVATEPELTSPSVGEEGELPADESDADDLMALLELLALMEETSSAAPTFDYLDTKFVCTQFSSSGATLDASMLGAEYAVYFRENGTADLTMAGYTIENLPYTIDESGTYVINYYGAFFSCVPTETGFDVDYYGTMTLHCTPAE